MKTVLRVKLVALELIVAVGAISAGWKFIADPSGASVGMPATKFLSGTPFHDFLVPGVVLLLANGLVPLVAVALTILRWPHSALVHGAFGALLTGWIVVQVTLLGYISWLQPVMFATGLAVLVLATLLWLMEDPRRPPIIQRQPRPAL